MIERGVGGRRRGFRSQRLRRVTKISRGGGGDGTGGPGGRRFCKGPPRLCPTPDRTLTRGDSSTTSRGPVVPLYPSDTEGQGSTELQRWGEESEPREQSLDDVSPRRGPDGPD